MKWLIRLVVLGIGMACLLAGTAAWLMLRPLEVPAPAADFVVEQGDSITQITQTLAKSGVQLSPPALQAVPQVVPLLMRLTAKYSQMDRKLKAGGYQAYPSDTAWILLQRMARGDVTQSQVALIDGWALRRVLSTLEQSEGLVNDLPARDAASVAKAIGASQTNIEGLLFPDTYSYAKGSPMSAVLKRAYKRFEQETAAITPELLKQKNLPYANKYEAIIMASIVEKETGRKAERERIAGVFVNRLRIGMPLQTDPTVIYGLGESFDGNLRKVDLQTDTPYNTYTRKGLPPTPIAMPGRESIQAALNPEPHKYLYFVAKGDGSSHFSATLDEHNRAVNKYQRGR